MGIDPQAHFENSFRILSSGTFLPERIVTNEEVGKRLSLEPDWIFARTGIQRRHHSSEKENTTYMAKVAAQRALDAAGIRSQDVGVLVVATSTPDKPTPSTASAIQNELGLSNAWCFDVSAGCSGFLYALKVASALLNDSSSEYALVVGSEFLSRATDWSDPKSAVLFGDGAGAMVIKKKLVFSPHAMGRDFYFQSTSDDEFLSIEASGLLQMNGREVFRRAVTSISHSIGTLLAARNVSPERVRMAVIHQANQRIVDSVREKLGLTEAQVRGNIDSVGNTGAASIPLLYDHLMKTQDLEEEDILVFSAFGAGFTWGSLLYRHGSKAGI